MEAGKGIGKGEKWKGRNRERVCERRNGGGMAGHSGGSRWKWSNVSMSYLYGCMILSRFASSMFSYRISRWWAMRSSVFREAAFLST